MINFEEYEKLLDKLADKLITSNKDHGLKLEELLNKNDNEALQVFEFRKYFVNSEDFERIEGYLEIGYFKEKEKKDRVTFFLILFKLQSLIRKEKLYQSVEKFESDHKLFQFESSLYDFIRTKGSKKRKPDYELIEYEVLEQITRSEIIKYNDTYTKLNGFLNPKVCKWCKNTFNDIPLFVNLQSQIASESRLPQLITEELQINPKNIDWRNFKFSDDVFKPKSFNLYAPQLPEEKLAYWDFHVSKIKRLEFSTQRKGDYRSFMVEELSENYLENENILLGKCLHFDFNGLDKNFNSVELNHLDYAINLYSDETVQDRLSSRLSRGRIADANSRIHLFRIDNIPSKALVVFVLLFFSSKSLKKDFIKYING